MAEFVGHELHVGVYVMKEKFVTRAEVIQSWLAVRG